MPKTGLEGNLFLRFDRGLLRQIRRPRRGWFTTSAQEAYCLSRYFEPCAWLPILPCPYMRHDLFRAI